MSSNPAIRSTDKTWLMVSLILVMAISALFDGLFFLRGIFDKPISSFVADGISGVLLVMWIAADRKDYPQVGRSFDDGFLMLLFWLPYLPYYLWRTRRGAGLWMFAGLIGLFSLGFLVQLAIWAVFQIRQ